MAGVLGLGGDLTKWSAQELAEAARLVVQYKDIRPVVQHGHQYRPLAPGQGALTAVQYASADADRVVVFVWRPSASLGPGHPQLRLRALDPQGRYRDEDTGALWTGQTLTG
jgi:alpha-galactosidase